MAGVWGGLLFGWEGGNESDDGQHLCRAKLNSHKVLHREDCIGNSDNARKAKKAIKRCQSVSSTSLERANDWMENTWAGDLTNRTRPWVVLL